MPGRVCLALLIVAATLLQASDATANVPRAVTLGDSLVTLSGPWKFRAGDDPRGSDPLLDDSTWESVDLKALAETNDGDVGLTGYVPGWTAKGHPGYHGYAWYRIRLTVALPTAETLAILGPWAVDSAYQMYVNGELLGGVGNFSGESPVAYSYHYPKFFALPPGIANGGTIVVAIRVWMGPWGLTRPGNGGIHIAPAIGEREAIAAQYRLQWLTIFEGYVVDAVPALLFVLMAVMVMCLLPHDRTHQAHSWLAAALLLSAIQRGNQAFFFWLEIESVQFFVYVIVALVGSLSFAAWMMAWRGWLNVERPVWLPRVVASLTLLLILAQLLSRAWLFHEALPPFVSTVAARLITWVRLGFLATLAFIACVGVRRNGREGWYAVPAVLAIGIILFASELAAVGVPGIWFPWGVGLSLGECASVVFDALLFVLLVRRLRSSSSTQQLSARRE